jgi:hypothetical protein
MSETAAPSTATFTTCCLAATLTLAVAALPAALRVEASSFLSAWLVAWGWSVALGAPLAGALGAQLPLTRAAAVLPVGFGLAALPLAIFAELLHRFTHHRPLGAVTFVLFALCGVGLALALAHRALAPRAGASRFDSVLRVSVLVASAASTLGWLALVASAAAANPGMRTSALDAALLVGAVAVAVAVGRRARGLTASSRALSLPTALGVMTAVVLLGAGCSAVQPETGSALRRHAPVVLGVGHVLVRH